MLLAVMAAGGCASREASAPPIDNFGIVDVDVWRGAAPDSRGYAWLAETGVRTIIDLQSDDLATRIPSGVVYVHLPNRAWRADEVDVDEVVQAIRDHPKPVYIHCAQGRDRTGLAVAGYRLSKGDDVDDVFADLDRYRTNWWWRGHIERRVRQLASR